MRRMCDVRTLTMKLDYYLQTKVYANLAYARIHNVCEHWQLKFMHNVSSSCSNAFAFVVAFALNTPLIAQLVQQMTVKLF